MGGHWGPEVAPRIRPLSFGSELEQTVSQPVLLLLFGLFYYKVMRACVKKICKRNTNPKFPFLLSLPVRSPSLSHPCLPVCGPGRGGACDKGTLQDLFLCSNSVIVSILTQFYTYI